MESLRSSYLIDTKLIETEVVLTELHYASILHMICLDDASPGQALIIYPSQSPINQWHQTESIFRSFGKWKKVVSITVRKTVKASATGMSFRRDA